MPHATNGDARIYYEVHGGSDGASHTADDVDAVAFCGEPGLGPWQWGWQHAALAGPYRVVVPAPRGTGVPDAGDSTSPPGPWSLGDLVADLEAVLADAGVRSAHLVGAGLGGLVALAVARRSARPERLVLVGTPPSGDRFNADALWADPRDPDAIRRSLRSALSGAFFDRQPDAVDRIVAWRAAEDADREAREAARAAFSGVDLSDRLHEVTTPALVACGTADEICPPDAARTLAEGLPRGEFVPVEGAGHLAHVECSRVVNDRVLGFLGG